MTTTPPSEDAQSAPSAAGGELRRRSLNVPTILFLIIASTAPLTAVASNLTISVAFGAGVGTLGWLVAISALLAAFTLGYLTLSRQVVNAAAYYAYIGYGLGRSAGAAAAFVATTAYNLAALVFVAAAGYFSALAFKTYTPIDVHWIFHAALALIIVGVLGRRGLKAAGMFTATASLLQLTLLVMLAVAVLIKTPQRFATPGFSPDAMFSGSWPLSLAFCVLCFSSYESAAVYAEETRDPRRSVPRATYGSLLLLAIVFIAAIWAVIAAFPNPVAAAQEDPGSMLLRAAETYLGSWAAATIVFSLAFTFWGAAAAFHNMAARYMFALARAGLLHRYLARTHNRHGSPHAASLAQSGINVAVLLPFALAGLDPLIDLFPFVGGVNSIGVIALMIACSISVVVASVRSRLVASVWSGRVFPSVAAVGLATIGVVIALNFSEVAGSDALFVLMGPLLPIGAGLYGVIAQRRNPESALNEFTGPKVEA